MPHGRLRTWKHPLAVMVTLVLMEPCIGYPIDNTTNREEKFFGIFNIVQFNNDVCNATDNMTGVCFSEGECSSHGGQEFGKCASGFGVCCVFTNKCGDGMGIFNLDKQVEYLTNQNYPQSDDIASLCMAQITPLNDDICQIRIDFEEFELDGGSTINKPCDRDFVQVTSGSGENLGVGNLCGLNTGKHIYIPVQSSLAGPSIRINTVGRGSTTTSTTTAAPLPGVAATPTPATIILREYTWKIKVTQIDCSFENEMRAPDGCSQYLTEPSGEITSYNFNPNVKIQYPRNLDYAICFKKPQSACQILLRRNPSAAPFTTSVGKQASTKYPSAAATTNADGCGKENGCEDNSCIISGGTATADLLTGDYILIPGGVYKSPTSTAAGVAANPVSYRHSDYYCGVGLGADRQITAAETADGTDDGSGVVSRLVGPVLIRIHSDDLPGTQIGDTPPAGTPAGAAQAYDELGFSLTYEFQSSCPQLNIINGQ